MTSEYPKFPKTHRLYDDVVITEKLDGTNGLISIRKVVEPEASPAVGEVFVLNPEGETLGVRAGSRNGWLVPNGTLTNKKGRPDNTTDNYGFAQWVVENAEKLSILDEGNHYGEWYGQGIQRGYGLIEKRFALFNPFQLEEMAASAEIGPGYCPPVECVPVLYTGLLREQNIEAVLSNLHANGSQAVPGYMRAEGIVIRHMRGRFNLKVVIDGNGEKRVG